MKLIIIGGGAAGMAAAIEAAHTDEKVEIFNIGKTGQSR